MDVYIDESGIHKQTGHSSIAVVYLEIFDLTEFDRKFKRILKRLDLQEFHWADQGWKVKIKFIDEILDLNFIFKVAIFSNPANPRKMLEIVLQHLITEKNIRIIIIDGKKSRTYEHDLKKAMRSKDISIKKLRTVRSETAYVGIQLADCLAGLMRYFEDNPDSKDAKALISKLTRSKKLFGKYIFNST